LQNFEQMEKAYEYYERYGSPDPKLLKAKQKLSPIELYRLLPKTNCRECGEQGCFPFAVKLANGEKTYKNALKSNSQNTAPIGNNWRR